MMKQDDLKKKVARAALPYLGAGMIIGMGTGSTVNYLIQALAELSFDDEVVASSEATEALLRSYRIPVMSLNDTVAMDVYVDGADECLCDHFILIKGAGGALTREKIIASAAKQFICIVDDSKCVEVLGRVAPVPVEVLRMARSFVARELLKLPGQSPESVHPVYRPGFITDNHNVILDVYGLDLTDPLALERAINHIPGVIDNGICAARRPDKILVASRTDVRVYE